ncbi:MAG: hypothetical protein M1835_007169 [Candelina submexicana]|nr:MAG: hypothetical protein M1835_007169 [Candelina submexicana]
MAPPKPRQRKSARLSSAMAATTLSEEPQLIATKSGSPSRTPIRSPSKRKIVITQEQKQALVDNLQLEITERARKLRAQYALQSQSLRTRVEMRVNRIPMALRKTNIGELLAKHTNTIDVKPKSVAPESKTAEDAVATNMTDAVPTQSNDTKHESKTVQLPTKSSPAHIRGTKRTSDDLTSADKENALTEDLSLPKKRAKTTASTRAASRTKIQPSQVLSPKSSNSRTLPHSPIRPVMSPSKSFLARPVSPLKPTAPAMTALAGMVQKARTTRATGRKPTPAAPATMAAAAAVTAAGGRVKRGAAVRPLTTQAAAATARDRAASNSSEISNATTVVTTKSKKAVATKRAPAANKAVAVSATGKKVAASVAKIEGPPAGRRVLRKRN